MNKFKTTIFWKVILRIYAVYCAILFVTTFLMNLPLFFIADKFNKPKFGLIINHYWAKVYFTMVFLPMEITNKGNLKKEGNYIFCSNHFSYLDVAILPFIPMPFKFIGKISIAKVPAFGYMFKKFHITVDRSNMREKYASYRQGIDALNEGFNLAVFPEGGIRSEAPPKMFRFKDGAFRMAIETGAKIVPVTLADNWRIFPTDGNYYFKRRKCRIVIHEPIDPAKYGVENLKSFQDDVFNLIQSELNRLNKLAV